MDETSTPEMVRTLRAPSSSPCVSTAPSEPPGSDSVSSGSPRSTVDSSQRSDAGSVTGRSQRSDAGSVTGRKRRAERSPSRPPPPDRYADFREQRAKDDKRAAEGKPRVMLNEMSSEPWVWWRDALNDIIDGKGHEHLEDWDKGWDDLCALLDERDALKRQAKVHRKEIKRLTAYCAELEHRLGIEK